MVCAEKKTGDVSLREGLSRRLISHVLMLLCFSLCFAFLAGCKEKPVIEVVEFPQSFADLVDKVQPAVVNISTTTTVRVPGNPFQHFFEQNPHDSGRFLRRPPPKGKGEIPALTDQEERQCGLLTFMRNGNSRPLKNCCYF